MKISILSVLLGAAIVLAIFNPVSLYNLISGQAVSAETESAIWITLSIIITVLIFALLYALWRDLSLQKIYESEGMDIAGQKGGEVDKKASDNEIYVNSLKAQSRKLKQVSRSDT